MVGIYLSGTGNTKWCVERLIHLLDERADALPIEDNRAPQAIKNNRTILLGYPVQFSNAPLMVRDFIKNHADIWQGKRIFCVATMGAFSGDGAGCTARLLKKYGAEILGGLHILMPDSVCDVKLLKKSLYKNKQIVTAADKKIKFIAADMKSGKYPQDGLSIFHRIAGLLGQRLWFYGKTQRYSDKLKINTACAGCGRCSTLCPMNNIAMHDGKPVPGNRCTMCYRCISQCPKKAITLIGKQVHEQCRIERYV